jgi:K+-sensing histidine kinase KdpD
MARDLGAEVIVVDAPKVADAITHTARQHGVTQIVIGQMGSRFSLNSLFRRTLVDQLGANSNDFDIHIVRKTAYEQGNEPLATPYRGLFYFMIFILLVTMIVFFTKHILAR